jgi:hypothetical protein
MAQQRNTSADCGRLAGHCNCAALSAAGAGIRAIACLARQRGSAASPHEAEARSDMPCPAPVESTMGSVALSHMLPCGEEGALVPPQRVTVSSQAPATPRRSLMLPTTLRTRIYPMHTR